MVDVDLDPGLFSRHREKAIAMYVGFYRESHNDKCMSCGGFIRLTELE